MKKNTSNYDLQVDIARDIFMKYDQELLIRKYRLDADGQWIRLDYMNIPCRISRRDGRVEELHHGAWTECRSFSTVMTIYDLLCHHRGTHAPVLSGSWCTVGTFIVTGVSATGTFTHKTAALFDGQPERLALACRQLGGEIQPPMAGADLTCRFAVTPFFPVLLQFWSGDEDFPAQLMLLWDRGSMDFLHFETTFYLQGDLLERLSALFRRLP